MSKTWGLLEKAEPSTSPLEGPSPFLVGGQLWTALWSMLGGGSGDCGINTRVATASLNPGSPGSASYPPLLFCVQNSNVENLPPHIIRLVYKEVTTLTADPPDGIKVFPNEEDLTDLQVTIEGPGECGQEECFFRSGDGFNLQYCSFSGPS